MKKPKCILSEKFLCPDPPHTRGLCRRHYESARRLVKLKKVTWGRLVLDGLALPKRVTAADVFRD